MKKFLGRLFVLIIVLGVVFVVINRNGKKSSGTSSGRTESQAAVQSEPVRNNSSAKDTGKSAEEAPADTGLIRADVKEAIDSYEAFIDEYCSFMESYNASDTTMLLQYMSLLQKELDATEKFDALEDDLSDAELAYYTTVQLRCSEKLLAASAKIGSNG